MAAASRSFAETNLLPSARAGRRILLAEDHPSDGRFLATVLAKAGYSVTLECNAQQVIDRVVRGALSKSAFDLVILDLSLNREDVITVTRRLRETDRRLPILTITAREDASRRRDCLDAGCDAHLAKPLNREQLLYEAGRLLLERAWPEMTRAHVHKSGESPAHGPFVSGRSGTAVTDRDEIVQATDCDV